MRSSRTRSQSPDRLAVHRALPRDDGRRTCSIRARIDRDVRTRAAMPVEPQLRRACRPVTVSAARTRSVPSASSSNVTDTLTSPRGAARRSRRAPPRRGTCSPRNARVLPLRDAHAHDLLPVLRRRETRVRSHGIFALRGMTVSQYPPTVSTTSARGVTSMSTGGGMLGVNTGARGGWLMYCGGAGGGRRVRRRACCRSGRPAPACGGMHATPERRRVDERARLVDRMPNGRDAVGGRRRRGGGRRWRSPRLTRVGERSRRSPNGDGARVRGGARRGGDATAGVGGAGARWRGGAARARGECARSSSGRGCARATRGGGVGARWRGRGRPRCVGDGEPGLATAAAPTRASSAGTRARAASPASRVSSSSSGESVRLARRRAATTAATGRRTTAPTSRDTAKPVGGGGMLRRREASRERRRLDRRADRHDLVGVHPIDRRRAEERLHAPPHERHARRPADEDGPVELARREARERERVLRHLERPLDERLGHLLELGAREPERRDPRCAPPTPNAISRRCACVCSCVESAIFTCSAACAEPLERLRVGARVEAVLHEERVAHAVGDGVVDVVAAEERVAGGGEHLEDVAVQSRAACSRTCRRRSRRRRCARCVPLPRPYASAAAVGSFRMRSTSSPATRPATFVAARCSSLKCAGTVMTARSTGSPSAASAICSRALQDERADLRERVLLAARDDERPLPGPLLHLEREPRRAPSRARGCSTCARSGASRSRSCSSRR